ncbi:uncharacterized protein LOC127729946 [Mytilus californianus]|uniref:uncharacterized protein LOC127729946 n=1 Tax=Mytilus californianus TaxID=6549 RepID=UPI002245BD70|nr:uncharacterized protein LOC127729946 [Mytilus californianus]
MWREILVTAVFLQVFSVYAISVKVKNGKVAYFRCSDGKVVDVTEAIYEKGSCGDPNALTAVQELANGKTRYDLPVAKSVFSSTCAANVDEKLKVQYDCVSPTASSATPNGDTAEILCNAGQYITITKATYADISNACFDANAFSIVQASCNNQVTCSIDVDSATFPSSTCNPVGSESLTTSYTCTQATGQVYTRWGSTTCGSTAQLLYSGFMAGGKQSTAGSGSDYLCMPSIPSYTGDESGSAESDRGSLYGIQLGLDTSEGSSPFDTSKDGYLVDCAVCQILANPAVFMQAATNTCPTGWTVEYTGYLMSEIAAGVTATSKGYACMDKDAPLATDSSADDAFVYPVEGKCGTLLCPNYEDNAELTCVVCSK